MKADALSKWLLIALLVLIILWSFSASIDGFQVAEPIDPSEAIRVLLTSVKGTPPPAWATQERIAKFDTQNDKIDYNLQLAYNKAIGAAIEAANGQDVTQIKGMVNNIQSDVLSSTRAKADSILIPIYTASKAAGDTDDVIFDKIIAANDTIFTDVPPPPVPVMNPISSTPLPSPIIVTNSSPSSMDAVLRLFSSVNSPSPPAWATPVQISKAGTLSDSMIYKNTGFNRIPNLVEIYAASKAAGDTDSVTYDKITAQMEIFLASVGVPISIGPVGSFGGPTGPTGMTSMSMPTNQFGPTGMAAMTMPSNQSRIPERINTFFRTLPIGNNTNEHKVLLLSVVSTPPPSWATSRQIADTNKQITNFMGTSDPSGNRAKIIFGNALEKVYTESKAARDTDSVTLDKLIAAMRRSLTSGEIVTADVYEPPSVNPSWAANKNPISLSDLPNWVITGAHDPSWMTPTQIAQLSTLQAQADNIKNLPEKLGLLFGSIRNNYILVKSNGGSDTTCLEQIIAVSNGVLNGNSAVNPVVPATEPSSIKTWPSFTTATLPSDLSDAISKVYAVPKLRDIYILDRIITLFYIKSMGNDPRGVEFGKYVPPPPKVTGSSLVPVGIQILCKLSDLAEYFKYLDGMGIPFLDQTMTPADYASKYPPSMIPPGLTAKIIDKSNGAIVWDPITAYVTNGTIAPFPNTTTVGTYIFYTNVGKIVPYEVPQTQSDRNAIDRILYNILDIFVTVDGTDKTSSLYGYLVNNLRIPAELISASSFISSFQFQNIVYETYSTVSEDFTGSQNDSLQLNKLHYGDGTKLFPTITLRSVLAYGSAIAIFGGAVYYAMKKKMFKRFR